MKYISKVVKFSFLMAVSAVLILSSCNKDVEQFPEAVVSLPTGPTLGETIAANPDDSLFYALIKRGGAPILAEINVRQTSYTMFVPSNGAMRIFINAISGGAVPISAPDAVFVGFINTAIDVPTANAIVRYNIVPQKVRSSDIPATFPNFQYPSIYNPAPTLSALLRLTTFPSTRNGAWVNNIPLTTLDVETANGIIHHTAFLVTPPSRYLWDRVDTDPGLTYLKAAIMRADSGTAAPGTLQGALLNIGANLTVFAPTDAAFQATLTGAIYEALVALGVPPATALTQATALASTPAVFQDQTLWGVLTAETVKGIVVYHILGNRAFTNNFPTTETFVPTLLNGGLPTHPGAGLSATFGVPFVSSATIKGVGNATPSNILINPPLTPDPFGTSDQHYLNGVMHKIDQVLLPQ